MDIYAGACLQLVLCNGQNYCLHSLCYTQKSFLITGLFVSPVSCESVTRTVAIRQE